MKKWSRGPLPSKYCHVTWISWYILVLISIVFPIIIINGIMVVYGRWPPQILIIFNRITDEGQIIQHENPSIETTCFKVIQVITTLVNTADNFTSCSHKVIKSGSCYAVVDISIKKQLTTFIFEITEFLKLLQVSSSGSNSISSLLTSVWIFLGLILWSFLDFFMYSIITVFLKYWKIQIPENPAA